MLPLQRASLSPFFSGTLLAGDTRGNSFNHNPHPVIPPRVVPRDNGS